MRNAEIGNKNIAFKYLEEAYTSENWLVRIYKVKGPPNHLDEPRDPLAKKKRSKPKPKMLKLRSLSGKPKEISAKEYMRKKTKSSKSSKSSK